MFERKNPSIQIETLTNQISPYEINPETFLAFRIEDVKGNFFNMLDILSIYISYTKYDNLNQKIIEKKYFNYETCDHPIYHKFFDEDSIKIFPPHEWLCFNTSKYGEKIFLVQ